MEFYHYYYYWPLCAAGRILVPWPGIEPEPPALGMLSLNHWTTREVLQWNSWNGIIEPEKEMKYEYMLPPGWNLK